MALAPGTKIGVYEIVSTLGAGGMGEVYHARDSRLNRKVAIKVLLTGVAADPEYLARFEREAQTLAALNHQNIAQIYGVEETAGGLALVMELVEGPTLADSLARGPMAVDHVMYIALQLAGALDYAHEAGVIHRDLKPANIKLRPDFTVKVLDFGLAKKLPRSTSDETAKLVTALTVPGSIFGTPAYMPPEVLRGGMADARADIFAFGVILYELLTGRPLFHRGSMFETAGAILDPAPVAWPTTALAIPEGLRYVVSKAMAKDIDARYQTISEMRIDLSVCLGEAERAAQSGPLSPQSGAEPSVAATVRLSAKLHSSQFGPVTVPLAPPFPSGSVPAPSPSGSLPQPAGVTRGNDAITEVMRPPRPWLAALVGALGVIALAGVGFVIWQYGVSTPEPAAPRQDVKYTKITSRGNVRGIAFSPDGRTAAFSIAGDAGGRVLVQDVAGGAQLEIWQGDLVVEFAWTPDGSSLVVSGIQKDRLGVWVVPRLGGTARSLPTRGAHVAVAPDGKFVALAMQNSKGFRVFPLTGGTEATVRMEGFLWLLGLDWGARSNRVAVLTQADDGTSTVWTIGPDGSDKRKIVTEKSLASIRWSPIDNVIYAIRPHNEVAEVVRLADREGARPEVVLSGLPWDASDPYQRQTSLSTDGQRLLLVQSHAYANLWKLPLDGTPIPSAITRGTSRYGRPRISPDGKWIATAVGTASKAAIVKMTIDGSETIPVTSGETADSSPAWSRDGSQIAFMSVRNDVPRIWIVDPEVRSASEIPNSAAETEGGVSIDWLADGRVMWTMPGSQNYAIYDLKTRVRETLLPPPAREADSHGWINDVRLAPNGADLALWWNRPVGDDQDGLWLLKWPSREERKLLLGDFYPAGWSPDGKTVYAYEYLGRNIVKVSVATGAVQTVGAFPMGFLEGCDVPRDAKTVICALRDTQSDAWLVENFDPKASVNSSK